MHAYPMGTVFTQRVSTTRVDVWTVIDVEPIFDRGGGLTYMRYTATSRFMGQILRDEDVRAATITRNLMFAQAIRVKDVRAVLHMRRLGFPELCAARALQFFPGHQELDLLKCRPVLPRNTL